MNQNTQNDHQLSQINYGEIQIEATSRGQRALAAAQDAARKQAGRLLDDLEYFLSHQKQIAFLLDGISFTMGPSFDTAIGLFFRFTFHGEMRSEPLYWPGANLAQTDDTRAEIETRIAELKQNPYAEFAVLWHVAGDASAQFDFQSKSGDLWIREIAESMMHETGELAEMACNECGHRLAEAQ